MKQTPIFIPLMLHRHFIGFELNKEYYDKAVQRIERERQQLTLF